MSKRKEIGQTILFIAIIGIIFGTGYFPTDTLAQEVTKGFEKEKKNDGNPDKPDNDRPNAGNPLDEDTTFCFGLSITAWRALGTHNVIVGTDGNDRLKGKGKDDVIVGGPGKDVITAAGGHDFVCGNEGNDTMYGGSGHDKMDGGPGDDTIRGQAGNDNELIGGPGEDNIHGGAGNDLIEAQDLELDTIHGGNPKSDSDTCVVDEVEASVKGCEVIITPYVAFG